MRKARLIDFLFTGAAVFPGTLVIAGRPDVAIIALCPLLIGACLAAAYLERAGPNLAKRRRRPSRSL
jgi:hypothetical protein